LRPDEHRALRELVHDVALRAGYPSPDEIHLFAEANAYAYRGGSWPRRGASVVGIGLPLLAWLDRRGIEAVIAHEIGHHVAGDTRLGPWVHRTRQAMARAIEHLEGSNFFLHLPFVAYGEMFIKYSLSVSREQELSADGLSLRIAGKSATASALVINEECGPLWGAYLATEVVPILEAGFLPPLMEGWRLFKKAIEETRAAEDASETDKGKSAEEGRRDLSSHPTLAQRLEAVGAERNDAQYGGTAWELLDSVASGEEAVLRGLFVQEDRRVEAVPWSEIAVRVWLPRWRESVEEISALASLRIHQLPRILEEPEHWAELTRTGLALLSPAAEEHRLFHLLGVWLCVKLAEEGFTLETLPGRPVRARRQDLDVEPFALVRTLGSRTVGAGSSIDPYWERLHAAVQPR
jgi:Zn-dependent protease with chaperone function